MKQLIIILLVACTLVAKAQCWQQSDDRSDNNGNNDGNGASGERNNNYDQSLGHQKQQNNQLAGWDSSVADLPDARPFVSKVNDRLNRIPNNEDTQELKRRVVSFASEGLHLCKSQSDSSRLHHHCVGRLIGSTMSMINNQQWHQRGAHIN